MIFWRSIKIKYPQSTFANIWLKINIWMPYSPFCWNQLDKKEKNQLHIKISKVITIFSYRNLSKHE